MKYRIRNTKNLMDILSFTTVFQNLERVTNVLGKKKIKKFRYYCENKETES